MGRYHRRLRKAWAADRYFERSTVPITDKILDEMPETFCGSWNVVSFTTPDGQSGQGEARDQWRISPDTITCGQSKALAVKEIRPDIEAGQNVHLVTFDNNAVQFAFLRSDAKPGVVLVIQYLNGEEMLRCLLAKA